MTKEKQKPGPKGENKPMGGVPEPEPVDRLAIHEERLTNLERALNELYISHYRRKAV